MLFLARVALPAGRLATPTGARGACLRPTSQIAARSPTSTFIARTGNGARLIAMRSLSISTSRGSLKAKKAGGILGGLIVAFPIVATILGAWQVKRYYWKQDIKKQIEERLKEHGVPMPTGEIDMEEMQFVKVKVTGEYIQGALQFRLGPRGCRDAPHRHIYGSGVSEGGHQIIAPFQLEDGRKILVARGWIPTTHRIPPVPEGKVTFEALFKREESCPTFTQDNDAEGNEWHWLDRVRMGKIAGTLPYVIDICRLSDKVYPIAGQVHTNISDNHLSYSITWFGIAIAGFFMARMRLQGTKVVRHLGVGVRM